ncbi:MAG: hypothetical protein H8E25_10865 [Planctomycetes bacterium]|nr:hypothetical protein [Planctomycetota bacterium]
MKTILATWALLVVGTYLSFHFTESALGQPAAWMLMVVAAIKLTLVESEFMELRHFHSVYIKSAITLTIICLGVITLVS